MNRRVKIELILGLVAVAIIVGLVLWTIRISDLNITQSDNNYTLSAHFTNVGSLTKQADITRAGVVIGKVTAIALDKSAGNAVVTMDIAEEINFLPTDSTAAIITQGLLGKKYIEITPGAATTSLQDGDVILDTQSAMLLEDIVGSLFFNTGK